MVVVVGGGGGGKGSAANTVFPSAALATAFIAPKQRLPTLHAIAPGRRATRERILVVGRCVECDGWRCSVRCGGRVHVYGDDEGRPGPARNGRHAQRLQRRDGPRIDVNGSVGDGRRGRGDGAVGGGELLGRRDRVVDGHWDRMENRAARERGAWRGEARSWKRRTESRMQRLECCFSCRVLWYHSCSSTVPRERNGRRINQ